MAKGRVEREKRVIKLMIELYCHKKHQHKSHGYVMSVKNY